MLNIIVIIHICSLTKNMFASEDFNLVNKRLKHSAVPANSFVPGNVRSDAHFHSFHSLLDQKLEKRIDFVLVNLLVQPCPLMSDECFSSNEFTGFADYVFI